jgi:DNA polymerase-1
MTDEPKQLRLLFDIETNGFLKQTNRIHCIAVADVDTRERWDFKPDQVPAGIELLKKATTLIGHNIQRFDIPALEKVSDFVLLPDVEVLDTYVMARVQFPNVKDTDVELVSAGKLPQPLYGKHKLAAWGWRLGEKKTEYDGGFDAWSQVMHDYMVQDVTTNLALWDHLMKDAAPEQVTELEHGINELCGVIEDNGVPFDVGAAGALHAKLVTRKAEIEKELAGRFGFWFAPISPDPEKYTFVPKRPNKTLGYIVGAPSCKIEKITFNPGSRPHIAKVMQERGWKPVEFTDGGRPKIDEDVVTSLALQFPEAEGLAEYLLIDKRLSQLADGNQAWLKKVEQDGKIHGVINPMGTTTSRASHILPNLGQVPNAAAPYGPECRALFGGAALPPGWVLVGADMEGLELRGLAHFLAKEDGGEYGRIVLKGDPHWLNACSMGLAAGPRDKHSELHTIIRESGSKRFIYAYVYGCGDLQAGQIIWDCTMTAHKAGFPELHQRVFVGEMQPNEALLRKVGKKVRNNFANRIPGFAQLKERIGQQVENKGYLPGLDGRRIPARSEHSALNFMIQSAGAILCKRWGVDAFRDLRSNFKHGWAGDFAPVLWVHDEYQIAAREEVAEEVGGILVKHAEKAGEPYNFRIPLNSKFKIGHSWADTH